MEDVQAVLSAKDLSFSYPGRSVLDGVSFDLQKGSITCLGGENGSGKTTLLNLLCGYLEPSEGTIRLLDNKLNGLNPYRIARLGLGRTFQDLRLIGSFTVFENIVFALTAHSEESFGTAVGLKRPEFLNELVSERRPEALLAKYFLTEVADQTADSISFGQRKLLTLACCVALGSDVLLLDEPVAGIGVNYQLQIAKALDELRASGKTILLIEHQTDFLQELSASYLYLAQGKITTHAHVTGDQMDLNAH